MARWGAHVSSLGWSLTVPRMELTSDDFRVAKEHTSDLSGYAPRPVIHALVSLTPVDEIRQSLAMREERDGKTTWRVLWLKGDSLVFVEATKADAGWQFERPDQTADVVSGWVRPLTEICSIDIVQLAESNPRTGNGRVWDVETRLNLSDGSAISLPLFGGLPQRIPDAVRVEAFLRALQLIWPSSAS